MTFDEAQFERLTDDLNDRNSTEYLDIQERMRIEYDLFLAEIESKIEESIDDPI